MPFLGKNFSNEDDLGVLIYRDQHAAFSIRGDPGHGRQPTAHQRDIHPRHGGQGLKIDVTWKSLLWSRKL